MDAVCNKYLFSGIRNTAGLTRVFWLASISIFLILNPYSVHSQPSGPLLQKLDSHYYYPSQLGLKKLTAKVKWLEKDLASPELNFISRPEVVFIWNKHTGERRFQIDPRLKHLAQDRKEEIERFFRNYREVILPRSLSQTLSGFKFYETQKFPSQTIVEYQSLRNQDEIQKYVLNIDPKFWKVSKLNIQRKNPPFQVVSFFKYFKKEGKWLVSETLSQFDMGRDSYSETTSYTYQKINGFWLPTRINQVFKKGRDVAHSYLFLFSDYQFN